MTMGTPEMASENKRRPSSTAYETVLYAVHKAFEANISCNRVVIDSPTYSLRSAWLFQRSNCVTDSK